MRTLTTYLFFLVTAIILFSCQTENQEDGKIEMIKKKISQYAETEIKYDQSLLDERQKIVVKKLYEAAKIIDDIFLDQVYSKNDEILMNLRNSDDELDKLYLEYFKINFGPFDRLDNDKPFYGDQTKPAGANYYPDDMTTEEFENWITEHPADKDAFASEFTVIRREGENLAAVPYTEEYKEQLTKVINLMREAAEFADNESLKRYLLTRAEAFSTNNYFESDMAWMDLKDHAIEIVIGPYEVYEDGMFNYKAAFESFLTIVDPVETEKLEIFANYLKEMEDNLPIPDEHKNYERGSESPIVVVQEVFSAGDTKAGVQTLAFNLPNDERVRKAKGSKKVMLKNIHEAKFEKLLKPIAEKVMTTEQLPYVTFDGFFNHTLMHEMSHGIGPGFIKVNGNETEVKKELKETYSVLEECKADILGMLNNNLMIDKKVYPEEFEKEIWATFLAGTFRSMRFGIEAAHGGGNAIIYNYMLENGAYNYDETTKKVSVDFDKSYDVLKKLASMVLMIQAKGDYSGAKDLIANYAVVSPSIKILTDELSDLPVDIKPVFQIEKEMNNKN
ncbi:MAG: peptidase [Melioribacteraceae bacterium]|nr:peptidase [Melioribacteraceae bacterium]MCF8352975.1 peptidase [Melioribacteraceae bacterium]MCF8395358.1 peptidase [Melioribacteraceae bacterium]MCF8417840.1 peptidase [Melioribacteraceae bacterium]